MAIRREIMIGMQNKQTPIMLDVVQFDTEKIRNFFRYADRTDILILDNFYVSRNETLNDIVEPQCFPILYRKLRVDGVTVTSEAIRMRIKNMVSYGVLCKLSRTNPSIIATVKDSNEIYFIKELINSKRNSFGFEDELKKRLK